MNIDNANLLIERLKYCTHTPSDDDNVQGNEHFTMADVAFSCGSPACIAGHAQDIEGYDPRDADTGTLQRFLRVPLKNAIRLYRGGFSKNGLSSITPEEAIEAIQDLIVRYDK